MKFVAPLLSEETQTRIRDMCMVELKLSAEKPIWITLSYNGQEIAPRIKSLVETIKPLGIWWQQVAFVIPEIQGVPAGRRVPLDFGLALSEYGEIHIDKVSNFHGHAGENIMFTPEFTIGV